MISTIKQRTAPTQLLALKALEQRLPLDHPKRTMVEMDLIKQKARFAGERRINYYLAFLPKVMHYRIFYDLRLKDKHEVQLDTLILTTNYIVLLETKHYTEYIEINELSQQMQHKQNHTETIPQSLEQIYRKQIELGNIFAANQLPPIPIYRFVLLTSPSNNIGLIQAPLDSEQIIRIDSLPKTIEQLNHQNDYCYLTNQDIESLSCLLLEMHKPHSKSPLEIYSISHSDLIYGVFCPNCKYSTLKRSHYQHQWNCLSCNYLGKEDHVKALLDYALLFQKQITNSEARRFLNIQSRDQVYRILLGVLGRPNGHRYSLKTLLHD